jgi:tetratricopeptide (TPR) repeat protein
LGVLALRQADFALAAQSLEQSLALRRAIGDRSGIAEIVSYLGNIALTTGDFGLAVVRYKEGIALFRELGDQWGEALALGNLGLVALFQRDLGQASVLFDEALALLQAIGDRFFSGSVLLGKGYMHLLQGEHERAEVIAHEGLQMVSEAGDKLFLNYGMVLMASVAVAVSAMLSDVFGVPLPPVVQIMAEQVIAAAQLQLDKASLESALAEGQAMTLEQATEYALTDIA